MITDLKARRIIAAVALTLATCQPAHALAPEERQLYLITDYLTPHASALCVERRQAGNCYGRVTMAGLGMANAFATGDRVVITSKMIQKADNDELAFVIAHEMAHNILGHRNSSPSAEIEADTMAVRIVRAARFNPEAGVRFVRRFTTAWIVGFPFSLLTHPITGRRVAAIRKAIEETE